MLYDALIDTIIAGAITAAIYFRFPRQQLSVTPSESILLLIIGLLMAIIYAITIPTIIDRSLSVYILEKLAQRGGSIRRDAFEEILTNEYLPEQRIVDLRLTEQLSSGTITIEKGCVRLTQLGQAIARFSRFYRMNLLPKRRDIMDEFTDDLTDPFRKSSTVVPFRCE